jgi:hypothetical protein
MQLTKDGKSLTTEEENLAELRRRMAEFEGSALALWRSLGLATEASPQPQRRIA